MILWLDIRSKNTMNRSELFLIVLFYFGREPVDCGSLLRLQHLATGKFLHSHSFSSPLSSNQEVSAFGENGTQNTVFFIHPTRSKGTTISNTCSMFITYCMFSTYYRFIMY